MAQAAKWRPHYVLTSDHWELISGMTVKRRHQLAKYTKSDIHCLSLSSYDLSMTWSRRVAWKLWRGVFIWPKSVDLCLGGWCKSIECRGFPQLWTPWSNTIKRKQSYVWGKWHALANSKFNWATRWSSRLVQQPRNTAEFSGLLLWSLENSRVIS